MILDAMKFGYGLFRDSQARKDARAAEARANARDDTKIRRLVVDSRAAGIHPLAALGSQVAGQMGSSGMVYSGDAAGDALRSVRSRDPLQEENARLQNESLKADIDRTRADTARILAAAATSRTDIARATSASRGSSADVAPPVKAFGGTIQRDPSRFSSADVAQQEFGEAGEWAIGLPSLIDAAGRAIFALPKTVPGNRLPGSQWTR